MDYMYEVVYLINVIIEIVMYVVIIIGITTYIGRK